MGDFLVEALGAAKKTIVLEDLAARALATGVCGVLVTDYDDGTWSARVTASVPHGAVKHVKRERKPR